MIATPEQAGSLQKARGVVAFLESTMRSNSRDFQDWRDDVAEAISVLRATLEAHDAPVAPSRQPLTDEQIKNLCLREKPDGLIAFFRMAERAHEITNDGNPPQAPKRPTADDMREPKNGSAWRVEWWNESARLMLPADSVLDSFKAFKNGTLMFTIKKCSSITKEGGDA